MPAFVPFDPAEIEGSIPGRFARQARRWPDRPAVSAEGATLSYRALDRLSDRIAGALPERATHGPRPVALLLPQGAHLVAATLAVLKAGHHYLGLDAGFPASLLSEILADADPLAILTTADRAGLAERVCRPGTRIALLDRPDDLPRGAPPPAAAVAPDDLAYVFYTSGSTGRPKAVVDCHRNVLHNVMRYTNSLRIGAGDRMTLLQSAAFSGSVSSLFGALLNGACSLPVDVHREGVHGLARWLGRERATVYHSVPALFRRVAAECDALPDLRVVRLEGDSASQADLRLFAARAAPGAVLVNGLGTTETGLVRQLFVSPGETVPGPGVPVGYPVPDMEVSVLDEHRRPLPPGEVGEIAVRSRYLAVGYRGAPELTRARFLPDPEDPSLRTYLTGDLGRMRPDGCLEHLGRTGRTVKVRGHGVELADVEAAVAGLPGIREAAVVALEAPDGGARLVAYHVPARPPGPGPGELRASLSARLAPFMIPSRFVPLPALPLTPHCKVDREALPALDRARPAALGRAILPRDLLERQIAAVWEDLLDVEPVGATDDFLDLGGDSLSAMAMLGRLQAELDETLDARWLLEAATVADLADRIRAERPPPSRQIVELQAGDAQSPFFFLHGDYLGGGYYARRLAREIGTDVPVHAVQPSGLDGAPPAPSYGAMAERHLEALLRIQPRGPYRLGGTCNGGLVAYEIARRLEERGERVSTLALFAASARNLRFRALVRPARAVSRALRREPEGTRSWMRGLHRLESALASLGALGLLRHAVTRAARAPVRLVRRDRAAPTVPEPSSGLRDHYLRLDREYLPGPYGGRVVLLWPNDEVESATEAARWWRRIARDVELREIPRPHQTCLTADAALLGAELRACLAAEPPR